MITCLKEISEEAFSFCGNVKITDADQKFLTKVQTKQNSIFKKSKFI